MSYILDTNLSSRQIYLQSGNANYYLNGIGSALYFFNDVIVAPNDTTILISIVDAQIPMSYYTISSNKNTLDYTENSINYSYSLDLGNTDAITLKSDLTTNLNNITCSYSSKTNKYSFTSSNSFSFNSSSTCFEFLGFSTGTHTAVLDGGLYKLISDNVVNLAGTKSIYVASNLHNNSGLDTRTGSLSNVLSKIPVNTSSNGILKYTNKSNYKINISDKHINYIHIMLEDDKREIIDFNGIDYSLTLQLDFIKTRLHTEDKNFLFKHQENEKNKNV